MRKIESTIPTNRNRPSKNQHITPRGPEALEAAGLRRGRPAVVEHFKPTYIDEEREKEKENGLAPRPPPASLPQQQQQQAANASLNSAVISPLNSVENEGPAEEGVGLLGEEHLSSNGFLGNGGTGTGGVAREVRGWGVEGFVAEWVGSGEAQPGGGRGKGGG